MINYDSREPIVLLDHKKKQDTRIKQDELNENDFSILQKLENENKIGFSFSRQPESNLQITTTSHIGSLKLEGPNVRINILPKMFENGVDWEDTNIFLDFASGNKLDYFDNAKNFYVASHKSTLLNRLHVHLISKCEELMKQGLLKSYVVHAENSSSMRGKLLMQYQMLNDAMLRPKFFCEFDELEYDSMENRVILQALTIVERTSDNVDVRMNAMDLAQKLSGVVQKTTIPAPERQRMMQSYNRQNLRYKDIHSTCEQVIQESGIEDIYRGDDSYVVPVFYDMNELFETFIQNIFLINRKGVKTQLSEKAWEGKGDLGHRRMRPDVTIWEQTASGKVCKQIIDVKYKTKNISSGDLYQIGFYMHEFEKKNPNEELIPHAFAITPEFDNAGSGSYTSRTGRKVFVKRINIKDCLALIKSQDEDKWEKLEEMANEWIEPIV